MVTLGQFFTDQVERTTVETSEKVQGRDVVRDFIVGLHMDPARRLHRVGRTPAGRTYRRHDETLLELLTKDLKRRAREPIAVQPPRPHSDADRHRGGNHHRH